MTATHPWLASYPTNIPWDVNLPAAALCDLLDEAEKKFPARAAIDFFGRKTSYKKLAHDVNRLAANLQNIGVGPGVHVGLFLPNCPQFILCYYAILKAGGTVVNYNPLYSVPEICHQIEDSHTQIMITLALNALYPKVASALGKTNLKKIIVSDMREALPFAKALGFTVARRKDIAHIPHDENHIRLKSLLVRERALQKVPIHPQSHIAVLQYTGGTTGVPKGAMLTHANLYINTLQCGMWFTGLRQGEETILAVLPLFHVFAMTVTMNLAIHTGMTVLLHPKFDVIAVLRDIHNKRPTLMPGVPTMYAALNNFQHITKYDLTSLKMCFSGGGPLPLEVKSVFEKRSGCKLVEGYGLSETSPVVCANPLFGVNKTGSIGVPLPATVMKIMEIAGDKTLPVGEVGEICIAGPQVMSGYFNNIEESAKSLRDGFFHTGDLGYMDEEGYFFVVDRLKEMIISGGYKIYPRNLEEILYTHPDILEAAVIGVRHPERVQATKVFVVRKKDKPLTESDIRAHLKDKVSGYAMPYLIEFRDVLPKSAIGKILKKTLIEEESKKK